MRIWLLAVRHGLLVHQKIVLLLSTSMAGSLVMASALLHVGLILARFDIKVSVFETEANISG